MGFTATDRESYSFNTIGANSVFVRPNNTIESRKRYSLQ